MTLKELRDDLLRKVWVEYPDTAPDFVFEDVAIAINSAFQTMWSSPVDYFRRKNLSISLTAGSDDYQLDQTVQEVIGPVTISSSGEEVIRARDQQEFRFMARRFLGATTADSDVPLIYYAERTNQTGGDPVLKTVLFYPAPTATTNIDLIVSYQAPVFTVAEVAAATTEELPVAHQYAETLLLPIARHAVANSHWFWDEKNRESFKEAAATAMVALGILDPDSGTMSSKLKTR